MLSDCSIASQFFSSCESARIGRDFVKKRRKRRLFLHDFLPQRLPIAHHWTCVFSRALAYAESIAKDTRDRSLTER